MQTSLIKHDFKLKRSIFSWHKHHCSLDDAAPCWSTEDSTAGEHLTSFISHRIHIYRTLIKDSLIQISALQRYARKVNTDQLFSSCTILTIKLTSKDCYWPWEQLTKVHVVAVQEHTCKWGDAHHVYLHSWFYLTGWLSVYCRSFQVLLIALTTSLLCSSVPICTVTMRAWTIPGPSNWTSWMNLIIYTRLLLTTWI